MNSDSDLIRGLSRIAALSIVIGTVIGTGIFLKARVMTCNVGTPGVVLSVWVFAGFLSLAGALTYAELAAMMPRAGGEYVFIREGYGRPLSFIYGWTQWLIVYPASQAAKAVAFAVFLNVLTGGGLNTNYFGFSAAGHSFQFGALQVIALSMVAMVTAINCAAVSASGKVASFLTALKVVLVASVGLGAFLLAKGSWGHLAMSNAAGTCEAVSPAARGGLAGFGAALLGALWAYDGWSNLTIVAGEVKDPERNLPFALIGGMLTIMALYLLVNVGYFFVLTPTEIASVPLNSSVATEVVSRFLGPAAVAIMAIGLMISTLGSLHSGILVSARIPYAMAQDRLFFDYFGQVSGGAHVPVHALIVQAFWIAILALSGSFDALTDYAMFAAWIFYGLTAASVFIFRKRLPNFERPYKTLGYPVVPVIFLLVTLLLIVNTVRTALLQTLIGFGLIALGVPLYYYFSRRFRSTEILR